MMYKKTIGRFLILAVSFSTLAGCSLLSPVKNEPKNTYIINAVPQYIPQSTQSKPLTLLVAPIQANLAYDSTQIAYTTQPYQISYFVNNHWAETPAQMLQPLIVLTLQKTHYFRAVIPSTTSSHYDLVLQTQLVQLEQDFLQHPSQVTLVLHAQLINAATNQVIATRQFSVTESAPQDTPYGGVIATNQATAVVLQQLTRFCVSAKSI